MNPWLTLPLGDYEGHMRSRGVDQLEPLSILFADVLRRHRPDSVAILGIAGGNGLEHVDPVVTRRVVGLDINPDYVLVLVAPAGLLSVVLQLPSETATAVGATAFPSMESLAAHFAFVDPDVLRLELARRGWRLGHEGHVPLASGKAFWAGVFARDRAGTTSAGAPASSPRG